MSLKNLIYDSFKNVVVYDFEYSQPPGENPKVVCATFLELKSGKKITHWYLDSKPDWPFNCNDTIYICHNAVAEVSCMLQLGMARPNYIWDTMVQDKKLWLGREPGFSLLDSCKRYQIPTITEAQKEIYRKLIINKYPAYSAREKQKIIEYNITDVEENAKLFMAQCKEFDFRDKNSKKILSQAIFHCRSQGVIAKIERNGIPINFDLYSDMEKYFPVIKAQEIEELQSACDIYIGDKWNQKKFTAFLDRENLLKDWPRTKTGQPAKDDRTLYRYSSNYPKIQQIRDSKFIIEAKNLKGYVPGEDKRSRCSINLFGQITGRTNVSTATNPFGAPRRMRNIIGTDKDHYLIYADWKSQEAVIQAALSGDPGIKKALASGDPYLYTAKIAGAIPADAIRKDYEVERELYKQTFLAVGYGQTAFGLKLKLGISYAEAAYLLEKIKQIYPIYFKWINSVINAAVARGYFETIFGWRYYISDKEATNPRRLMNWPLQSHGSEILRRAIIDLDNKNFEISMPVHDAVLIHSKKKNLRAMIDDIKQIKQIMSEAAFKVIGWNIAVDTKLIGPQYKQSKEHQERWNKLYEKLLNAKNQPSDIRSLPSDNRSLVSVIRSLPSVNQHTVSLNSIKYD